MSLAANLVYATVAGDPRWASLAADPVRAMLAANSRWARLVTDPAWARLASDPAWARLAADAPRPSMAVDSCSVCLGDHGRILKRVGSNQQVHNHPRISFTASFPSHSGVQELTGFLNVSSFPRFKAPTSFHLCTTTSSLYIKHGDCSCCGCL